MLEMCRFYLSVAPTLFVSELIQNFFMLSTTKDIGSIWRSRYNFQVLYKEQNMTVAVKIAIYAGLVMCKV